MHERPLHARDLIERCRSQQPTSLEEHVFDVFHMSFPGIGTACDLSVEQCQHLCGKARARMPLQPSESICHWHALYV